MKPTESNSSALEGRTYLITGGTTGIGLAVAQRLTAEGARVIVTGRNPANLAAASDLLGEAAEVLPADASDVASLAALVESVGAKTEALDGIFLNAGIAQFGPIEVMTEDNFDAMFGVNVKGAFFTLQALLPLLRDGGSVVFNASIAGRLGMPGSALYAATKAAVVSLGKTLAVELAPRGIRVNTLSPGPIRTPIVGKIGLDAESDKALGERPLLRRWGRPEEVAALARFLLSEESSYLTGEDIAVDGGIQLA